MFPKIVLKKVGVSIMPNTIKNHKSNFFQVPAPYKKKLLPQKGKAAGFPPKTSTGKPVPFLAETSI